MTDTPTAPGEYTDRDGSRWRIGPGPLAIHLSERDVWLESDTGKAELWPMFAPYTPVVPITPGRYTDVDGDKWKLTKGGKWKLKLSDETEYHNATRHGFAPRSFVPFARRS